MKLESITHGFATLTLAPGECLLLAQVCDDWPEVSQERTAEIAHVQAFGAALRAAAIAAQLQYWCNLSTVRQAMHELGMPMN